ncbi:N-acetylneuraminate lyase, partial [Bombyx mori]|uniref:N-acetylneuraminate lyase n=1 Tax=Bombyx mori TaxID=7091 RepID=A0A8R2R6R7_BOMMO
EEIFHNKLEGLFCPVFTPLNSEYQVNVSVIPDYAKYLKDKGVDGVVVAANIPESSNLSVREKKELLDAWVAACKPLGLKVMLQVGGVPSPDIIELVRYAVSKDADGILALPPPFYSPETPEDFTRYIEFLTCCSGGLPIYYDNVIANPNIAALFIMAPYFERASNEVENFKGMRGSFRDAMLITSEAEIRSDQEFFLNKHLAVAGAMYMGFNSYITPILNFLPELIREIRNYSNSGDSDAASETQDRLNHITSLVMEQGDSIAALKAATELTSGISLGGMRAPHPALSNRDITEIKEILNDNDIEYIEQ